MIRAPNDEVVPGVPYGRPEWVPTPAFWATLAALEGPEPNSFISAPGSPLVDDVAFCILGGYGVKMELNRAAWDRLKSEGIFESTTEPKASQIEALLRQPLFVDGKWIHYRFPRQRASRLSYALNHLKHCPLPSSDPLALRSALMTLPGIGPKTASWIVRNWAGSNDVAILDVHVIRAGQIIGLFPKHIKLPRDYAALERRFLDFAQALEIPASLLDAIIWREMRILSQ